MRPIQKFEKKSGVLRLILYLYEEGETMLSSIWEGAAISIHQGYDSIDILKEFGLIKARIDQSSYPPKNMISLTDKGRKVAKHLKEIEDILKEVKK